MKKNLIKLLSVVLSIVMLASVGSAAFSAQAARNTNYYPTIVIPGVFQSDVNLYNEDGTVNTEYSKPFYLDSTTDIVLDAVIGALVPISQMLINQEDKDQKAAEALADVLGEVLLGKVLAFNDDGSLKYDIRASKYGSVANCTEAEKAYIYNQIPLADYTAQVGEDNLYFFSYYSFDNIMKLAQELYAYIQTVKAETGSDKVNIVPISQGGTLANALLEMYPDVKNDLNRIVYIVPALDGTNILGDIFLNGLIDDDNALYLEMFPKLLGADSEWLGYLINFILRIMPNADLNTILDVAVDSLVNDYIKYTTCMWALVPSAYYEGCAEKYLSSPEDAELKAQTDWYYQAQLNSDKNILAAIDAGVEVFDIVDYNSAMYAICDTWNKVNADGIIQVDSTSMGATSVAVDVQLPADYVAVNSNCTNPAHNHIDSHRLVDASTGLLPENTFYFYNQNHERTASNDVLIGLAIQLLVDENFVDVYSYPDKYPQFNGCRLTKGLKNDIKATKSRDLSAVDPAKAAELTAAIADVEAALANTIVTDESNAVLAAAEARYNAAKAAAFNTGAAEESDAKEDESVMDKLKSFFTIILSFFSKIFYSVFGGKGFSDILNGK